MINEFIVGITKEQILALSHHDSPISGTSLSLISLGNTYYIIVFESQGIHHSQGVISATVIDKENFKISLIKILFIARINTLFQICLGVVDRYYYTELFHKSSMHFT